ncbi:LysR family transcriptional regulator [Tamaricihabitans halophyticus]|uniref:LysR family transcriptional regulator n=1 Tax=Tamaricihabitans halophyticus TaxID=1262583 RepID=A0A4R2QBX8_9PSEU|nr:LysR family transcriptional regulator [Tamaricihabitans halophyticus]TCP45824.1 LysR family transcriptional regulator [Tamaricihabitans halophyticus]
MIDLRRLQVLRAVEQCGGVTAAARALHLTPSAVSQQVRALANDLGVELLVHEGRGVKLTSAAHLALRHAHELFRQWEEAAADIRKHEANPPGTVRLCGFPSALTALLIPTASALQESNPAMRVHLREAETPECFELLLSEEADLAVVVPNANSPTLDDPRFDQSPLLDDVIDLLVPDDHHLAERDSITLSEAASETWIVAEPTSTEQHALAIGACTTAGFRPRIGHYATDWQTVLHLVTAGYGVYLLPRLVEIPAQARLRRLPVTGKPRLVRRILVASRKGSRHHAHLAAAGRILHGIAAAIA